MTQGFDRFRHEALIYSGSESFIAGCVPFIRDGLEANEPILVVESAQRTDLLRGALGSDARRVSWLDMSEVGTNPARIIPAWHEFVSRHGAGGTRLRGIGEPIWKERPADELIECQRHESLLNVAFGEGRPWWLLCPYDAEALDPSVIAEARRSHEFVMEPSGSSVRSESFRGQDASAAPFDATLPEPTALSSIVEFDRDNLLPMRGEVARQALAFGLGAERATNLVTAVNEVATNSIVHGGGAGVLRVWRQHDALVSEVRDRGAHRLPLADRTKPAAGVRESCGLWLANQLCDLVQIRNFATGTVIRLHMRPRQHADTRR
ncbi:MAG TPA: sensor histidine kinase [Candidatus Dormibacteraeota bacterium]|nr:sensor histidine kinase [Candidatus Dormibacteraeota bacterium]